MIKRALKFVNNLRIVKRLKVGLLIYIKKYNTNLSPESLLLMQQFNSQCNRLDIAVRFLALEYFLGKNDYGLDLYRKLQMARVKYKNESCMVVNSNDLYENKKHYFEKLIKNIQVNGYNLKYEIETTKNYQLYDGAHRLACALYFRVPKVRVYPVGQKSYDFTTNWFEKYFTQEEVILIEKKIENIIQTIDIKSVFEEILFQKKQKFGRGQFYQSFERLGIQGQRPTVTRINEYRLFNYLKPFHKVLDIGSNCGFLALEVSYKVSQIVGVEINQSLVNLSNAARYYLNIKNASFIKSDFNNFHSKEKFNFIFSFAVHEWVGGDIKLFANKLWDMLENGGYLLFESQNLETLDSDWNEKVVIFKDIGFITVFGGKIKDDNIIQRAFVLFQKMI